MAKLVPSIIRDRLEHRGRQLRIAWHEEGEALLVCGQYVAFADGLLRITRQLAAIEKAVGKLPQRGYLGQAAYA